MRDGGTARGRRTSRLLVGPVARVLSSDRRGRWRAGVRSGEFRPWLGVDLLRRMVGDGVRCRRGKAGDRRICGGLRRLGVGRWRRISPEKRGAGLEEMAKEEGDAVDGRSRWRDLGLGRRTSMEERRRLKRGGGRR